MSFVAEARIEIDASPEVVFEKLADHRTWMDWMPPSFTPAVRAEVPHYVGKRFGVKIAGLPVASTIQITSLERPRLIAWTGGMRGLLRGHHEFHIASDGKGGTVVRSVETWSGVLAPVLRPMLKPAAERIGSEQLAGLVAACRAR